MVPFESLAVAASGTAAPAAKFWFAVGLVSETVGAGLVPPPMEQAVPFSVNAVGGLLAPLNVPLNATLNVPLVGIALFQSALLAAVTVVPDCVTLTGHPFCSCCPFGKLNTSVQPFVMAAPVFRMSILAPKPLPPTQVGQVKVMLQLALCACAADALAIINAATNNRRYERDMMFLLVAPLPMARLYPGSAGAERACRRRVHSVHRKSHSMDHGPPRTATTTVVKRDPPVKRDPSYPRRQRCPYVETAVSGFGQLVSRAGRDVSPRDRVP